MSSISASSKKQPARQYVAAVPFHNDFFSYTTSYNAATDVTTGTLSAPIAGASASTCPAGRILRESGKKLYPDTHAGVSTYMVGVIDSVTFLAGFIDPDSPVFAVSNNDVPAFFANGVDPGPGGLVDAGQPVYTNGSIRAAGNAVVGGTIVANGQIRSVGALGARPPTIAGSGSVDIDVSQTPFVFIGANGDNTLTCSHFNFGDRLVIQMSATGAVTFSTGFAVYADTISKIGTIVSFICDGAHMIELSRSTWGSHVH